MANQWQVDGKSDFASGLLMARTGRTDVRTNERLQDPIANRRVPDERTLVDKAIIRRRWSFMWGSPGWYWRVSHSSIPQGRPLYGSVRLYTFVDALEYANARVAGFGELA
jgi:hypothetical protein